MSKQNLFLVIKLTHAYTAPVKIRAFDSYGAKLLIENKSNSCCPLNRKKKMCLLKSLLCSHLNSHTHLDLCLCIYEK